MTDFLILLGVWAAGVLVGYALVGFARMIRTMTERRKTNGG